MTKLYAHRGLSSIYPENSIEAVKEALKYDYIYGIEIDVRMTKDRKFVVIHDSEINLVSNGFGFVCDMTLEELRKLTFNSNPVDNRILYLKSFFTKDGKSIRKKIKSIKNKKSKILTLESVLNIVKNKKLLIEIKYNDDECFDLNEFYKLIKKYNNIDISIQSFSEKVIKELRKKDKSLNLGILIGKHNIEQKLNLDVNFISIEYFRLTKEILNNQLKLKHNVNVWTVDTYRDLRKLKKKISNINNLGIITNNPDILKKYI